MRTDEVLRRIDGLDRATLDRIETAGWVTPARHSAGEDPRWWSDSDVNKIRDVLRLHREGRPLDAAYEAARRERFFGLCPCDWRPGRKETP